MKNILLIIVLMSIQNMCTQEYDADYTLTNILILGFGIVGEIKLLKNAGLTNYQILEMTTRNFADFFNGNYSTIQKGKEADFLILNDNPIEKLEDLI